LFLLQHQQQELSLPIYIWPELTGHSYGISPGVAD
jgi:hypothetical protein